MSTMYHYAQVNAGRSTQEVIVLGYRASDNMVMVCNVNHMPGNEQSQLREIVASQDAQNSDYLLPVLEHHNHPSGETWRNYLVRHAQNSKIVRIVPMKEVQAMNDQQAAFFKGYGKSVRDHGETVQEPSSLANTPASTPEPAPAPAQADNSALVNALNSIAEGQQQILQRLENMGEDKKPAPKAKKSPGRPRKKKTEETASTEA